MIGRDFRSFGRRWLLCWVVGSLLAVGCGRGGLPATRAVNGKVVYKGGDVRLLEGGTVEFQLISDPNVIAAGEIKADGTFSLSTWSKDGSTEVQGAAAGEHKVRVDPPRPGEADSRRLIGAKYRNFDKSGIRITLPADKIEITVEKGP